MVDRSCTRREFTLLTATTAGALLTGSGRAVQAESVTDRYAFLLGHVASEFEIPTLARFTDESGLDSLAGREIEHRARPEEPAAYARLTPGQAEMVADEGATDLLEYAPGANPFWKLDGYGGRVFPRAADSVDFVALEEARAGLAHLESTHPDRLRVESIGEGHGHERIQRGENERRQAWLAELTDGVGSAEGRETVVFSLSIHGDERAGVEAGLRFVEDVLTGERPEIATLLSELRLVFVCPNPDGWVVRQQIYEDPVEPPDFRRPNGADRDLNRQQPTAGWIRPTRLPGEPRGANLAVDTPGAVDDDVPPEVAAGVPETLALVQRLRSYERLEYLVDLHGMYGHTNALLAIESGGGTPTDRADTDLLTRAMRTRVQEQLGAVEDWTGVFETAAADSREQVGEPGDCEFDLLCELPVELFGDGTGLDTIGYTVSGGLDIWADLPEAVGGLGATSLTMEVVFSNSLSNGMERRFISDVVAFQVAAYGAVCDATVRHAADEVDAAVETGGRTTAYLADDTLARRAVDLPHVDGDTPASEASVVASGSATPVGGQSVPPAGVDSTLAVDREQFAAGPVSTAVEIPPGTHSLTVDVRADSDRIVEATLRDCEGNAVAHTAGPADGDPPGRGTLTALDPRAGEWQVETTARGGPVEVRATRLVADGVPDPRETLGYGQRDYEVTPLAALDALGSAADAPVEAVSADTLRAESLVVDGVPTHDNLLLTHDHGVDEQALAGLEAHVEAGGNLVLTDSAVGLVTDLDVAGLSSVGERAVTREELEAAAYPNVETSHPLVADRRTFDEESSIDIREPWTHPPMGYAVGEVPAYSVTEMSLEAAGGTVASAVDGRVRLGTVPTEGGRVGVHLLGSLLPPATQENLHPFGLLDHSLSRLGYLVLCNALGYRLSLSRNGQQVVTLGSVVDTEYERDRDGDGGDDSTGGDGDNGGDDSTGGDGDNGGDDSPDGTTSTDGSGPGFGVAAGVAGAGGLGYLLARRAGESE